MNLTEFVRGVPKAELHVHLEGTLEPEMMFELARRNRVTLPYASVDALRAAYKFRNLEDFLDLYYRGMSVLQSERDFTDLTWAYLEKAKQQNVVHAEVFFDPQGHSGRGIAFGTAIDGIRRALVEAEAKLGITHRLIPCFLRHLGEADAEKTLREALPYRDWIAGFGLDSAERGNPPAKFARVFARAKSLGFKLTAHAGEEGPAAYVKDSLDVLQVDRIDHGNHCLEDERLVRRLANQRIGLTVCPLSNVRLCGVPDMKDHPLPEMLRQGLAATVNSDDPAYFGGYVVENFLAVAEATGLGIDDVRTLVENSFRVSFLDDVSKQRWIGRVREFGKE